MGTFSNPSLRTIREEQRFTEQLEQLGIDPIRWDEVFSRGLQFVLARSPELFHRLPGSPLRVATVECYRDLPAVNVLFAYDDNYVYLLDIYLSEGIDED